MRARRGSIAYSASGYVVPRVGLAAVGVDPRVAFAEERFWHSHEAVVRAVVAGRADFGATYAGVGPGGEITRGSWMDVQGADEAVRVLVQLRCNPRRRRRGADGAAGAQARAAHARAARDFTRRKSSASS